MDVLCFFCRSLCVEDEFCFGCSVYVCPTCDGAPSWIFLAGPRHEVWAHRYQEMQKLARRALIVAGNEVMGTAH